jgi:small conductance mechanosensitive channel
MPQEAPPDTAPPTPASPDTAAADTAAADTASASSDPGGALSSPLLPNAPSDTTGTDLAADAVERFNQFFQEIIRLFVAGDWEGLNALFYEGGVRLMGLFLENGLKALAAFLVLYAIYKGIDKTLHRVLSHSRGIDAGLQSLLQKSYRVVAFVFIGSIVLGQIGVNVTALVAGLSIAGIAVGFAARDSLENFISGVTILVDQPFRVGDHIVVDGEYGRVSEITLRSTRIQTVRNEVMVLPNTEMITQRVVNHTKQNTLRIDISFGIAYKEFPEEARQVLLPLVEDDDRVLSTPSPSVVVTSMGDSSVDMVLRFYITDPSQELPVRWEYTEKVREALREADIEIPFPHRQLFLDGADGLKGVGDWGTREGGNGG